jgi:hypothetical protein
MAAAIENACFGYGLSHARGLLIPGQGAAEAGKSRPPALGGVPSGRRSEIERVFVKPAGPFQHLEGDAVMRNLIGKPFRIGDRRAIDPVSSQGSFVPGKAIIQPGRVAVKSPGQLYPFGLAGADRPARGRDKEHPLLFFGGGWGARCGGKRDQTPG